MIEKTQEKAVNDTQDDQISATNLKSMAGLFKRGISESEKSFYDTEKWIDEIKKLLEKRKLFDGTEG